MLQHISDEYNKCADSVNWALDMFPLLKNPELCWTLYRFQQCNHDNNFSNHTSRGLLILSKLLSSLFLKRIPLPYDLMFSISHNFIITNLNVEVPFEFKSWACLGPILINALVVEVNNNFQCQANILPFHWMRETLISRSIERIVSELNWPLYCRQLSGDQRMHAISRYCLQYQKMWMSCVYSLNVYNCF